MDCHFCGTGDNLVMSGGWICNECIYWVYNLKQENEKLKGKNESLKDAIMTMNCSFAKVAKTFTKLMPIVIDNPPLEGEKDD